MVVDGSSEFILPTRKIEVVQEPFEHKLPLTDEFKEKLEAGTELTDFERKFLLASLGGTAVGVISSMDPEGRCEIQYLGHRKRIDNDKQILTVVQFSNFSQLQGIRMTTDINAYLKPIDKEGYLRPSSKNSKAEELVFYRVEKRMTGISIRYWNQDERFLEPPLK